MDVFYKQECIHILSNKQNILLNGKDKHKLCHAPLVHWVFLWKQLWNMNFDKYLSRGSSWWIVSGTTLTWGILNKRRRFATWMEVTLEAAPTTPDITLRTWVLLQWYSAPSMLLIEPVTGRIEYVRKFSSIACIYKNINSLVCTN